MIRYTHYLLLLISTSILSFTSFAKGEEVCECIKIKIDAADTIKRNTYLNYKFTIKNTCSTAVWVHTGYFGFALYDLKGKPVKRLRELTFVKRYKYPDFVLIDPKAEYEFKFSDDPFFEYKLERHTKYVLGLKYSNSKAKHKTAKNLNFLCPRELKRFIYVK
jgi:hypothetical protein